MSERFEMRVPEGLLARVDEARGDVSRSRWVLRAIEAALEDEGEIRVVELPVPFSEPLTDEQKAHVLAGTAPVKFVSRADAFRQATRRTK